MLVRLKDVRLSFCDLFEAKEFKPGDGKPRYNATFLITPNSEADKAIEAAIVSAASEAFGAKAQAQLTSLRPQTNKFCYTPGDLKDYDGWQGMKVLAAHRKLSDGAPGVYGNVIDPQTGKVVVLTAASGKPYSGCYVNASVDIWAQKGENTGIRCSFVSVQFWRDGDAFSGAKRPDPSEFEAMTEGADAEDLM